MTLRNLPHLPHHLRRHSSALGAALALCSGLATAQSAPPPAPAAGSGVRLSGLVDLFAAQWQLAGTEAEKRVQSGGMSTSQLTFSGTEALDSDLKAEFSLSSFLRADTGQSGRFDARGPQAVLAADGFWARAAWVGLSSAQFGTVRLGRQSTVAFLSAIRLNPMGDSTTFAPALIHTWIGGQSMETPSSSGPVGPDSGWNNMLSYSSPRWGGVTLVLQAAPGEQVGGRRQAAGLQYAAGPWFAALTHEQMDDVRAVVGPARDQQATQLGLSYDLGVVKLFGQAQRSTLDFAVAPTKRFDTTTLGASAPWGRTTLMASWGRTVLNVDNPAVADTTRQTLSLAASHAFSRNTDAYLVWMNDRVTAKDSGNTLALGLRAKF